MKNHDVRRSFAVEALQIFTAIRSDISELLAWLLDDNAVCDLIKFSMPACSALDQYKSLLEIVSMVAVIE